jgi:hypothetical protein
MKSLLKSQTKDTVPPEDLLIDEAWRAFRELEAYRGAPEHERVLERLRLAIESPLKSSSNPGKTITQKKCE